MLDELGNAMFGRLEESACGRKIGGTPLPFRPPPAALCFRKRGAVSTVPRGAGEGVGGREFTALGWGMLMQDGVQNGFKVTGSVFGERLPLSIQSTGRFVNLTRSRSSTNVARLPFNDLKRLILSPVGH